MQYDLMVCALQGCLHYAALMELNVFCICVCEMSEHEYIAIGVSNIYALHS